MSDKRNEKPTTYHGLDVDFHVVGTVAHITDPLGTAEEAIKILPNDARAIIRRLQQYVRWMGRVRL